MTAVAAPGWQRMPPGTRLFTLSIAGAIFGAVAVFIVAATRGPVVERPRAADVAAHLEADRSAVQAYADAIATPVEAGGALVVYGMRPGVTDIAEGRYPDGQLVQMASDWAREMQDLHAGAIAISAPPSLDAIAAAYERAFQGYVNTADALLRAARARGLERTALLGAATRLGTAADLDFDKAAAALSAERVRLGIADATEVSR